MAGTLDSAQKSEKQRPPGRDDKSSKSYFCLSSEAVLVAPPFILFDLPTILIITTSVQHLPHVYCLLEKETGLKVRRAKRQERHLLSTARIVLLASTQSHPPWSLQVFEKGVRRTPFLEPLQ
ncbi:hypothetical protein CB1_000564007 [Camelus ferus]|nr:hypothetical protein CB1_000564007 [Camelus ferus]